MVLVHFQRVFFLDVDVTLHPTFLVTLGLEATASLPLECFCLTLRRYPRHH